MTVTPEILSSIIQILSRHPEGMRMKDLAGAITLNRNAVAKYLGILHQQGQVDVRHIGKAKIFTASKRIPFSVLTEVSRDYIVGLDRNLNCVGANSLFYAWTGCTPGEILGKSPDTLSCPVFEQSQIIDLARKGIFSAGEPVRVSCMVQSRNNIYEIRCMPVIFWDSTTGCAIVIADITSSETAADEISLLKEQYQALADTQSEYIIHSLPDGRITFANPAFAALADMSAKQLVGKRFHLKIPKEDLALVRQHFGSIRSDDPEKSIEHRVLANSGEVRWIRWTNRGIFRNGELIRYHSHGTDCTELKVARNRLQFYHENIEKMIREKTDELQNINRDLLTEIRKRKQTERNLQKMQFSLNNSSEMILWTDEGGVITSSNKSALDILGILPGNVLCFLRPGISGPQQLITWEDIWEPAKQNSCFMFEAIIPDKNKNPIHGEVLCNYLYFEDVEQCCLFIRDITSRKLAEHAMRESEDKFRHIFESVNDAIYIHEMDDRGFPGRFIEVNEVACTMVQYSRSELLGMSPRDFIAPSHSILLNIIVKALQEKGQAFFEIEHIRKDGAIIPVEINAHVVPFRKKKVVFSVVRDITQRKQAETELARLNTVLRMLSDTNEALIHIADEATLMNEICRVIVEVGGHRMAWIGFAEQDEAKTVRPMAHAGFESGYLECVNISWAESELGLGPGGIAIRTGQPSMVRNVSTDPTLAQWKAEAKLRDYQSIIALPLTNEDRTFGVLVIYARDVDAFDTGEVEILKELAGNLAFGLTALRTRAKREQAEEDLRFSEEKYRLVVENSHNSVYIYRKNRFLYANTRTSELTGYTHDELIAMNVWELLHPDDLSKIQNSVNARHSGTEERHNFIARIVRKNGDVRDCEFFVSLLMYQGQPTILGIVRDITDRV